MNENRTARIYGVQMDKGSAKDFVSLTRGIFHQNDMYSELFGEFILLFAVSYFIMIIRHSKNSFSSCIYL